MTKKEFYLTASIFVQIELKDADKIIVQVHDDTMHAFFQETDKEFCSIPVADLYDKYNIGVLSMRDVVHSLVAKINQEAKRAEMLTNILSVLKK